MGRPQIDLTGMQFGRLKVLSRSGSGPDGKKRRRRPTWLCRCSCGVEKVILGDSLKKSLTESCGCLLRSNGTTHGQSNSAEYRAWDGMQSVCLRQTAVGYKTCGARGITVCESWLGSFEAFLTDVGMRPTPQHRLTRKDTTGNYEPGNVRWLTRAESDRVNSDETRAKMSAALKGKPWSAARRAAFEKGASL
jgi:hypothetical protein